MASVWGNHLRLAVFGESHGPAVGVTLDGLAPGLELDLAAIARCMARRAPGGLLASARRESDAFTILSGLYEGCVTGAPLTATIANADAHSADYAARLDVPRPGHADYTAHVRQRGFEDPRGGGHHSGRLTAPLVFAGAVCAQYLQKDGIRVYARLARLGGIDDRPYMEGTDETALRDLRELPLPALDGQAREAMARAIEAARAAGDSLGGIVECLALGVPAGWGAPLFDSLESTLAGLLFSIPAVTGVEFGDGFAAADRLGSENNDAFCWRDGAVRTRSNHCGGVQGGVSNGMPIVFRVSIKPTPSIARRQESVSLARGEGVEMSTHGRHDPCIAPRAVPVVEAVANIALLEMRKEHLAYER